jgi:predicted Zn-dependent peptidase
MRTLLVLALAACSSPAHPVTAPPPHPAPVEPLPAEPRRLAIETPVLLAQPLANDPTHTTIHRLSNGMTVYLSPDPQQPTIVAHVAVRAGSRNDPRQSTGLAHYLEHMLFKGTTRLGTLDYAQEKPHLDHIAALYGELRAPGADRAHVLAEIDRETQETAAFAVPNELDQLYARMGIAGLNAETQDDATVYVAEIPKNRIAQWARVEAQRYSDAVFRLFWPELEAVYEEKNRNLDDPAERVRETFMRTLFPEHGYGWSSGIGEIEHLKTPAYADMEAFFRRYYTPQNMAILLAGDVDASVLPVLEKELGQFRRPAGDAVEPAALPRLAARTQLDVTVPSEEGVVLGWQLVPATHDDRIALEVMDLLLFDGVSGMLSRDLLLPQKVADAGSDATFLRESGYYELRADALDGQSFEELEQLLLGLVGKLQRGEFTDTDLATAILTYDINRQREIESNDGRMALMEEAFTTGEAWPQAVARVERMRKVTRAEVQRVASKYLDAHPLVIHKVAGAVTPPQIAKPPITPLVVDPTRQSAFAKDVLAMPVAPIEPVAIALGKDYRRQTLATGPLVSVENPRNGLFVVGHEYERGRFDDRLLCFALDVWKSSGAGALTAVETARKLHELGLVVETSCGNDESGIYLSGVDTNLDAGMALVREWLANPSFDDKLLKAKVAATLTERHNEVGDPQTIATAQLEYARMGADSVFLVQPSNKQLQAVTAAQIKKSLAPYLHLAHRTQYFGPRAGAAAAAAALVLGDGVQRPRPRKPLVLRPPGTAFVTDQDTAQTHVWLVWPRKPATDPERAVGTVFGAYAEPVLYQQVREARGLAYTVYGGWSAGPKQPDAATVYAYVGTQADKTHDALDAVLATLRAPVDQPRFAQAKEALAQSHRVDRVPPRAIAATVYAWEDEGEAADPRDKRAQAAQAIERPALEAWMKAAVAGKLIVSIVGPRKHVDAARLGKLAPVTIVSKAQLFGY